MADLRSRIPAHAPAAFVGLIVLVAMSRVLTQHWRQGAVLLGVALLMAAVLRVLLPVERLGLLAVRSRVVDVLCFGGFGVAMVLLATTITKGSLTLN